MFIFKELQVQNAFENANERMKDVIVSASLSKALPTYLASVMSRARDDIAIITFAPLNDARRIKRAGKCNILRIIISLFGAS